MAYSLRRFDVKASRSRSTRTMNLLLLLLFASSAVGSADQPTSDGSDREQERIRRQAVDADDRDEPRDAAAGDTGTGSGCPCSSVNGSRYVDRMDIIKNDILRKLRMLQPPNATVNPGHLPQIPPLRELLNMTNDETARRELKRDFDDDHVTTMSIIAISQPVPPELNVNLPNVIQFKFNTSGLDPEDLVSAQLGVYVRDASPSSQRARQPVDSPWPTQLHINRVYRKQEVYRTSPQRKRKVQPLTIPGQGRWMTFDIKQLVKRWIGRGGATPDPEYGDGDIDSQGDTVMAMLQVEAKKDIPQEPINVDVVLTSDNPADQLLKPYIEIRVKEQTRKKRRRRRSASSHDADCDETSNETRCCRYPLTVDFTEFGWDWVLAPKRYEAYYCSGLCPFVYYQVNPHTHLSQQAAAARGAAASRSDLPPTGSPCCAPSKLSPLPLVYMDLHGGIVYGTLPDMIVERCGCA